jgi:RNA polymerase sigma-70 factor (ECF subfamily)
MEQLDSDDLTRLMARIAGREESALAELYDRTSARVFGLVFRILADRSEAEESTLDVYLQVWRSAPSFRPERGAVVGWLLLMARSRAIDRLRAMERRRSAEVSFADHGSRAAACAAARCEPADAPLESEERRQLVVRAVCDLPEKQRRAIELAFFDGMSHREIAARLATPLGTVKTQIRLGMDKLREALLPLTSEGCA